MRTRRVGGGGSSTATTTTTAAAAAAATATITTTPGLARALLLLLAVAVKQCTAHMAMAQPPSINYKSNPNVAFGVQNYDYTSPLSSSGSDYPCKGELKYLGSKAAAPVATYAPGGSFTIKLDGETMHGGGSCQASLSYDKGQTFNVIKSWVGNCPATTGDGSLSGTIPGNAPKASEVVFAWTWFNEIGNREMYMNCAVVTIGGGKKRRSAEPRIVEHAIPDNGTCSSGSGSSPDGSNSDSNSSSPSDSSPSADNSTPAPAPLLPRAGLNTPQIFLANIGNGCGTLETKDVIFPSPGSVVQYGGDPSKRANPVGTCNGQSFAGGGAAGSTAGGSGTGSSSGASGTKAGTDASAGGSSAGAGAQTAGHQGDCAYWQAQGYSCSSAAPSPSALDGRRSAGMAVLVFLATVAWHLFSFSALR